MKSLYEIYLKRFISESEVHNTLNPKLWTEDNKLKDEVSQKILEIVDVFREYLEVPIYISDIRIVGSNASYNYTQYSDLDIHIIVNFDIMDIECDDILKILFNTKKSKFNKEHNITIKDIPVELYIEDEKSSAVSNGIYSITNQEWIEFPQKIYPQEIDISSTLQQFQEIAQEYIQETKEYSLKELQTFIDSIYLMRKDGLSKDGEFSLGNLVFKELRNSGILQELNNKLIKLQDKELSLESLNIDNL